MSGEEIQKENPDNDRGVRFSRLKRPSWRLSSKPTRVRMQKALELPPHFVAKHTGLFSVSFVLSVQDVSRG